MPSQPTESPTRLGVVQFLNTKPLVHAFEAGLIEHPFELIYDVPSECARKLHAGETDVALIPAIEIGRGPEPYSVVRGVGIGSVGPVNSVFLVLNKDPENVGSVAMDTSSRSSVALTRILFEKKFGTSPQTFDHAPDVDGMLAVADAAVLIGDIALELDRTRYRVLDLGQVWTEWTGLPFVYACWTGRVNAISRDEQDLLVAAKFEGIGRIAEIAAAYAEGRPFLPAFYAAYLTESVQFDFGAAELEGMRCFFSYAAELGLIDEAPDIRFYT